MIIKFVRFINFITFGIVFLFCFAFDVMVCLLDSIVFSGEEITNIEIICSYLFSIIIATIVHSIGKFKIFEMESDYQRDLFGNQNKIMDFGNIKLIYKNVISVLGYQKVFIIYDDDKRYFIGNKIYHAKCINK